MPPRRLSAEWVWPVEGRPIRQGAVLVGADGRIAALGEDAAVPDPPGTPTIRFASAALLPGLVNAHTHLELTGLEGLNPEDDFAAWIARIIALKSQRTPQEYLTAARQGLKDCFRSGITTIADTGDSGAAIQALHDLGGSGIAYLEVFGPHPASADGQLESLRQRVASLAHLTSERIRLGVSPHAPYSVSGPLYAAVARWAREAALPIAVHIAESPAETELLRFATGSFARAWQGRGIPLPALPGRSPIEWLEQHGVLGSRTLCIHVVQAGPGDLALLSRRHCGVAHCPRSNRRHGHGDAPIRAMLEAGLRVGVGTDSVVSLSPLDLLAEARAAQRLAGLDAARALELCTIAGARALGLEAEIGSLVPGKWGDLAVVRLPGGVDESALAGTLLTRGAEDVLGTYASGRVVWSRGEDQI